jgi:hypothetical protein
VLWPDDTCVTHTVRDADVKQHTNVITHAVTVWQICRVYPQGFEYLVSNATDTLGARRVLIITRKTRKQNTVFEHVRYCGSCNGRITQRNVHECNKLYCETCKQNKEIGNLCYMQPVKNELPPTEKSTVRMYSMISKRLRIHGTLIQLQCTFRIWYVYNSSVRDVRVRKISSKIVCSVVRGNIRFGRIR